MQPFNSAGRRAGGASRSLRREPTGRNTSVVIGWNASSLVNPARHAEMQCSLNRHRPLAVAVSEADKTPAGSTVGRKFVGYRWLAPAGHRQCAWLVRNGVAAQEMPALDHVTEDESFAAVWIRLTIGGTSLLACSMYRWPGACKAEFATRMRSMLHNAHEHELPLLVIGDFNAQHGDWAPDSQPQSRTEGNRLQQDIMDVSGMHCLNTTFAPGVATHRLGGVLDLAWVSQPSLVQSFTVDTQLNYSLHSDHTPIVVQLHLHDVHHQTQQQQTQRTAWRIAGRKVEADWSDYAAAVDTQLQLHEHLWNATELQRIRTQSQQAQLAESTLTCITACILSAAHSTCGKQAASGCMPASDRWYHMPAVRAAHCIYRDAQLALRREQRLAATSQEQLVAARNRRSEARKLYEQRRNEAQQQVLSDLVADIESAPWSRATQTLITRVVPQQRLQPDSISDAQGQQPRSFRQSLVNLADHFEQAAQIHQGGIFDEQQQKDEQLHQQIRLQQLPTSPAATDGASLSINADIQLTEVTAAAQAMRIDTASGADDVHAAFLRFAPPRLLSALHALFQHCWKHAVMPQQMRDADVTPIHKGGKAAPTLAASWRPISLTSCIARLFERVIKPRLTAHLQSRGAISTLQCGFTAKRSTSDHLLRLTQRIAGLNSDQRRQLPVVFLDIKGAYDTVPHELLMHKLHHDAHLSGRAWLFIRSFLKNRRLRVCSMQQQSSWRQAKAGLPQGSVLAPLLWNIYLNDALQIIEQHADGAAYADDVAVWPAAANEASEPALSAQEANRRDHSSVRATMQHLDEWSRRWRVKFSPSECGRMTFRPPRSPQSQSVGFRLQDAPVPQVTNYKYLGMHFTPTLQWTQQHQHLMSSGRFAAFLVSRLGVHSQVASLMTARLFAQAVVKSRITYALPFWQPSQHQCQQLDTLLARPLRAVLRLPKTTGITSLLIEAGIMPTHESRLMQAITLHDTMQLSRGVYGKQLIQWAQQQPHKCSFMLAVQQAEMLGMRSRAANHIAMNAASSQATSASEEPAQAVNPQAPHTDSASASASAAIAAIDAPVDELHSVEQQLAACNLNCSAVPPLHISNAGHSNRRARKRCVTKRLWQELIDRWRNTHHDSTASDSAKIGLRAAHEPESTLRSAIQLHYTRDPPAAASTRAQWRFDRAACTGSWIANRFRRSASAATADTTHSTDSAQCSVCRVDDTREHALMHCARFSGIRMQMCAEWQAAGLIGAPSLQQLLGNVGDVAEQQYDAALQITAVYLRLVLRVKRTEQQQQLQQNQVSINRSSSCRPRRSRLARSTSARLQLRARRQAAMSDAEDDGDAEADTEAAHALRRATSRTRRMMMSDACAVSRRTARGEAASCARDADLVGVARGRGNTGRMQQRAAAADQLPAAFSLAGSGEGAAVCLAAGDAGRRREDAIARAPCHDAADEDAHADVPGVEGRARMIEQRHEQ